ncbi:LysM peptidoglycan-binding domain-containing protein [Pseudalkalibacillus decolorationis]|uniref:LysM peptidoglycan-binding domain-containing protein n=1 Tax=Pseudalkalibacillus decolorationis TaxID=163879 RepID=UPI002148D52A|nr:LysM peptidoglycan-binding domain-containing protein [Pseudalkalibacillus decolorationis]
MKKKILPVALAAGIVFSGAGQAFAASGSSIINSGDDYLGKPYRYGAPIGNTSSFDCSSFTATVFREHGINLPRTSRAQATVGTKVSKSNLQVGDLLFYDTDYNGSINHVAIYAGNGKMLGAQSSTGVAFADAFSPYYWGDRFVTARRVLNSGSSAPAPSNPEPSSPNESSSSNTSIHVVKRGDTLWGISIKYNTSISKIKQLNNIPSYLIYPGQRLKVSGSAPATSNPAPSKETTSNGGSYTVRPGDTLWEISIENGVSLSALMNANNLTSDLIFPGQKFIIPN